MYKFVVPVSAVLLAAPVIAEEAKPATTELEVSTKGGLKVSTSDDNFSFKIGGRMQLDYNSYDGVMNTAEGESGSDLFFRRGRIEFSGHMYDWDYEMAYNVIDDGSLNSMSTTYTGFGDLFQMSFGQQKENFGLEDTGSSKWITALERSMPANAFDTGNNVGIRAHGANEWMTYSVGMFKESVDAEDNALDQAFTGRFVVRPIYNDDVMVHVGAGYTAREGSFSGFGTRLGVRGGEDKTANKIESEYIDDNFAGDTMEVANLELAANVGSVHFMGEVFDGTISGNGLPDQEAKGYSAQLGWILTGEKRQYKTSSASFDKVSPDNAGGAWEIFARVDGMDTQNNHLLINDGAEKATTTTVGANWYVNDYVKVGMNYVRAETDREINGYDEGDAVVARLQVAF